MQPQQGDAQNEDASGLPTGKIAVIVAVAIAIGVGTWQFGGALSLDRLAEQESALRQYQADHPIWVYGAAFLIYVTATGLSLPGATVLTLVFGWYFGFWEALLLVSFASTAGATLAFLLSRFLFRDMVQTRFASTLTKFNESLRREGPFYLFSLRLIPAVPFFVINAVMGLTPMKASTFWWISQIGMLPGTIVYVYAGSSVPNLQVLARDKINAVFSPQQMFQILIAFVLLGIFPLLVRIAMNLAWRNSADA